ncbi:MAG: NAD-dependent epimerase/dehydratase family protein [Candidatus Aminicenantes bacterium]|nr:NAD-dependent epimerase/dehydratase family protein [Acidobacteriota bacterium]MBU4404881.1 NAD-dependent epimerase/dehydratase family protein [Acidobacteriota bacterium]MCG2812860.1 NAD-dependent epimerase/dehydratase family protein [Candidatus Aminicenantes bacterium]
MNEKGFFDEKRALVTGAGGFIGSHVVEQLVDRGYEVVCLMKYGENPRWIRDLPVRLVEGDLLDHDSLRRATAGVPLVIHLAGRLGGWANAAMIDEVNISGTRSLFEAFRDYGRNQRRFLFVSSLAAVGGTPPAGIYDESHEAAPISDYGWSKLRAERYLLDQDIPATVVRLPLVYGPRGFRGMYPLFKLAARGLQLSIGKTSSIVGFVEDIARGIIQAAENATAAGEVYFLGEDRIYNSKEICAAVGAAGGRRTVKIHVPYPLLYSSAFLMEMTAKLSKKNPLLWRRTLTEYLHRHYRFSTNKARRDFGFANRVPLAAGVRLTADWYRRHGHL